MVLDPKDSSPSYFLDDSLEPALGQFPEEHLGDAQPSPRQFRLDGSVPIREQSSQSSSSDLGDEVLDASPLQIEILAGGDGLVAAEDASHGKNQTDFANTGEGSGEDVVERLH